MTKSISLSKTLALAVVSHLAITTASFGHENIDLSNAIDLAPVTKTVLQVQDSTNVDIENQLPAQNLNATQILDEKGKEAFKAFKILDTGIKYGIVAGGIAVGAGLAWFYGPALAFTATYKASIFAATALATPTWYTYNCVIVPGAIDAGIYVATSSLVHAMIGTTGSALGYALGKAGCATYEGLKYTVGTGIPAATKFAAQTTYDVGAYAAPIISNAAYTVASTAASVTGSALSSVASATSSLASSAWNWWSSAKSVASITSVLSV